MASKKSKEKMKAPKKQSLEAVPSGSAKLSLKERFAVFREGLGKMSESLGIFSIPFFIVVVLLLLGGLLLWSVASWSLLSSYLESQDPYSKVFVAVKDADGLVLHDELVTLSYGDKVFLQDTVGGVAVFEGIPRRTRIKVSVEREGFAPFSATTMTSSAALQEMILELEKAKQEQFFLYVNDENGNPLPEVTVYSKNPDGSVIEMETDDQGKVPLNYSSLSDSFNVRLKKGCEITTVMCFARKGLCEAVLKGNCSSSLKSAVAHVTVEVLDKNGTAIAGATVSVLRAGAGGPSSTAATGGGGKAFFSDIVAIGDEIYIVVEPPKPFVRYVSEPKRADESTEFLIVVSEGQSSASIKNFNVTDS